MCESCSKVMIVKSTLAPGEACGASLGDQLLDLGGGRSGDLRNRDV